jgi:hypothetical protein
MDIQQHTTPDRLERYSFIWSLVRLVVAAVALFLGGVPPVLLIFRNVGIVGMLLTLSWIISGLAAVYLLYRWTKTKTVFGGKQKYDVWTFFIMVVSGLNLGLVGILGTNIGMSISSNRIIFLLTGIIYLVSAYHLYTRWKSHGQKVF